MTDLEPMARRPARPGRWRAAALTGASLVLIGGAAVTMAASPAPSGTPDGDEDTTLEPGVGPWELRGGARGGLGRFDGVAGFAGRHGGFGAGNITITAISGSSISLETADGWTRTVEVTDSTELSKDGEDAELTDLEVGDRIAFRQTVDDAGSWSITAIAVVQPSVVGQVTAVDGSSVTLTQPDGSTVTVHVDGSTELSVGGEDGKALGDVEVGMVLVATGELNDDGSLDATRVRAGSIWDGMGRRHGRSPGPGPGPFLDRHGGQGPLSPSATPGDDASTSAS